MEEILEKTKLLLTSDEKYVISDVCKLWPMTNENLKEVYKLFDVKDKAVLTVTSSGDHIFESLASGAKTVDSFDINYLTEYYYYLKKAIIQSYKASSCFNLIELLSYGDISKKRYNKLRENLDGKYQLFWDIIIGNYLSSKDDSLKNLYNTNASTKHYNLVNYLSRDKYKLLKEKLDEFDENFIHCDIFSLDKNLDKSYDLIYLSNIYRYVDKYNYEGLNKIKEYSKTKLYPFLNDGGTIVYGYLYGYSFDHFNKLYILRDNDEINYTIRGLHGKKDCLFTLKK